MNQNNKSQWNSSLAFLMSMIGAVLDQVIYGVSTMYCTQRWRILFHSLFCSYRTSGNSFLILEYGLGSSQNILFKSAPQIRPGGSNRMDFRSSGIWCCNLLQLFLHGIQFVLEQVRFRLGSVWDFSQCWWNSTISDWSHRYFHSSGTGYYG